LGYFIYKFLFFLYIKDFQKYPNISKVISI